MAKAILHSPRNNRYPKVVRLIPKRVYTLTTFFHMVLLYVNNKLFL